MTITPERIGAGSASNRPVAETVALAAARGATVEVQRFIEDFYRGIPDRHLSDHEPIDLYGAALSGLSLLTERRNGDVTVEVFNPTFETHGWRSPHTVIQLAAPDGPFVVDSLELVVAELGYSTHLSAHPVCRVVRDERGVARSVLDPGAEAAGPELEMLVHLEIDHETDPTELATLDEAIRDSLDQVRLAVGDWSAMECSAADAAARLRAGGPERPGAGDAQVSEAAALLDWLRDDHFVFLGAVDVPFGAADGAEPIAPNPLGILGRPDCAAAALPTVTAGGGVIVLTKSAVRSRVHRSGRMDVVAVELYDDGKVVGQRRFVGLFTANVYTMAPTEIPIVRRKIDTVLAMSGFTPGGHGANELVAALWLYPRDELFEADVATLLEHVLGIVSLRVRDIGLFVRRDLADRFVSCLVLVPRDRFSTEVRVRIIELLSSAFGAQRATYETRVPGDAHARLHVVVFNGHRPIDADLDDITRGIEAIVRAWDDDLRDALVEHHGEERGLDLHRHLAAAFPSSYAETASIREAVADINRVASLIEGPIELAVNLYRPLDGPRGQLRFKLYRCGEPITLTTVLPVLQHLGAEVTDERPFELAPRNGPRVWIYDFGLHMGDDVELDRGGVRAVEPLKDRFESTFLSVWAGTADDDALNGLVFNAGLTCRQVSVLRAYSRYLLQIGVRFSHGYVADAFNRYPRLARGLVELFETRFDPDVSDVARQAGWADMLSDVDAHLGEVATLDDDRILRTTRDLVTATLRTNFFQCDEDGSPKPYVVLKLDPRQVPGMPEPRPASEIFVCSPRVEGVHLRSSNVARGGIRWSDRREDYRTEVLDLMKAQVVKNSVIVPTGAKGGFVARRLAGVAPSGRAAEGVACYQDFVSGLLDVTGNRIEGRIVPPERVVRYDSDDAYLVVAADKGTASFSDIANELACRRGFWLGDAFASGGSTGYDHKEMGITARGAWVSVEHHFRSLGRSIDRPFTVIGIGDMSGDVFGNGMLLSESIHLVAAFDHRHVFLDPDPDPVVSSGERRRLFDLAGSTWADYDPSLISSGGGVWARSAKSIPVSVRMAQRLGLPVTEASVVELTPAALVSAILCAPVDLLWNGGVGTFVKATHERNTDVGDKANDAVRIDASSLRCAVIGEGGNLGLTQAARVEFADRGGRVFMDAVDNAAGVNASDHEVNIKILLDEVVADGDLTLKHRNELLDEMTADVAEHVLESNRSQVKALANALATAPAMIDVHAALIAAHEAAGSLVRAIEQLPTREEIAERRADGKGLTAPELAVLVAFTKNELVNGILDTDLPDDPAFDDVLAGYFPMALRERFGVRIPRHPLRRELLATILANSVVDRAGLTMLARLGDETSARVGDLVRANLVAWQLFDLAGYQARLEEVDDQLPADLARDLRLDARRLTERATRWLVRHCSPLSSRVIRNALEEGLCEVAGRLDTLLAGDDREAWDRARADLTARGAPPELAERDAGFRFLVGGLDIVDIARSADRPVTDVASVYFALADRLELGWLRDRVLALGRTDRWDTLARSALRDDLYAEHAALTRAVIGACGTSEDPVDAWTQANEEVLGRYLLRIGDIRAAGRAELAQLSVAVREIRNLRTQLGTHEESGHVVAIAPTDNAPGRYR